jgi:hypothetical protein
MKMKKLIKEPFIKCSNCDETKPRDQFFKRLSLAQTAAMLGKTTAKTRTTVISKNCKACQAKLKSTKPLTKKQIQNKINSGDLHPILGKLKKEQIDREIPEKRRRAIKIRWQKHRSKERKELSDALQQDINKARNTYYAYKRLIETQPTKITRQNQHITLEEKHQARLDHLAVLETQYRNLQKRKEEELARYDSDRNLSQVNNH